MTQTNSAGDYLTVGVHTTYWLGGQSHDCGCKTTDSGGNRMTVGVGTTDSGGNRVTVGVETTDSGGNRATVGAWDTW